MRKHVVFHTQLQKCEMCGKEFLSKLPSKTCSNKCRQLLYRERKKAQEDALEDQYKLDDAKP